MVGGGDDEDPERGVRPRGAEAVVLVDHVGELVIAGDGDDHVVGEAVPDCADLRAAGHLG